MVKQGIVIGVVVVCVMGWWSERAWAAAAGGAVTDRQVFTLTAAGAAKVANAEKSITQAVRILGLLGRVGGYVGGALLLYDVVSNTWDWWNQTYPTDLAGNNVTDTRGSWGTTQAGGAVFGPAQVWFGPDGVACGGLTGGVTVVGMSVATAPPNATCNGAPWNYRVDFYYIYPSGVNAPSPLNGAVAAVGGTDRNTLIAAIDSALADHAVAVSQQSGLWSGYAAAWQNTYEGALEAARSYLSAGVGLTSGTDYTQGSGYANGDPSVSGNAKPDAVAPGEAGESGSIDFSAVTGAVAAASAAITSAISASQAAVVSAVNAVSSAVSASQAAIVSAVEAIPAAITAGTTAVVSAVGSVADPIVQAVTGAKTDIVAAINAQSSGGGAGATEAVNNLAAADAARDQAAQDAVAARPAPAVTCGTCTRVTGWQTVMQGWQSAAQAAPIFQLVGQLAWPGGGTIARQWSVGSWMGHTFSIDLDQSGLGTVITVVRFVVVGGAVIIAYMILFG